MPQFGSSTSLKSSNQNSPNPNAGTQRHESSNRRESWNVMVARGSRGARMLATMSAGSGRPVKERWGKNWGSQY
eukprot:scaffold19783_cov129-Isochrysis_galbana.AAC.1